MSDETQRLAGEVAIVTGASRGMGRSIATTFGREGAAVAVVARTESQWDQRLPGTIHETVADIVEAGGRAVAIAADLSKEADLQRIVDTTRAELGPCTILVNNAALTVPGRPPTDQSAPRPAPTAAAAAATSSPGPRPSQLKTGSFLDFPIKGFRMHFEVGLFACYRLMQMVLPEMVEAHHGAIVNISSLASRIPGPGPYERPGSTSAFAYGGNKAALEHLTAAVAIEMAEFGIVVNALSPSEPILTPGNLFAAVGESNFASPEDFAEATLRVALAHVDVCTGRHLWSEDVLHPELGERGWLRPVDIR